MSWQAVRFVLEHSQSRGRDRLVMLAIAEHAGETSWSCWPSVPTIAKEAGMSRASVFRSLRALVESGEIVRESGGGTRSNRYRIVDIPPVSVENVVHTGLNETPLPSQQCDGTRLNGETRTINEPSTTSFPSQTETPSHVETGRVIPLIKPCAACGGPTQWDCTCPAPSVFANQGASK